MEGIDIKTLIYWIGGSIALTIAVSLVIQYQWPAQKWIIEMIGTIGSIASLVGVIIALVQIHQTNQQIKKVETIAQATSNAVESNKTEIRNFLSIVEAVRLIEKIKAAEFQIRKPEYALAHHLMQEIKNDMLRMHHTLSKRLAAEKIDLRPIIKNINLDLVSLFEEISPGEKKTSQIKPRIISQHLEKAQEVIIKIETIYRNKKI